MSTYQPNIPTGTVNLDVDYQNIQANFQQLDTSFGVDHVTFSNQTAQNGYHKSIHFNPVSTIATDPPNNQPVHRPPLTGGFGQLFSAQINDGINADEALYFLTGGNRLMQLTRNFQPVAGVGGSGQTFLPGGLIIQWGQVNSSLPIFQTVNFATNNMNFPNNCFAVFTQIYGTGTPPSGPGTIEIRKSSVSNTGFQWAMVTSSNQYTGFYWIAIGN